MYLKCRYNHNDLDVDYYPHLLTDEHAKLWYDYLEYIMPQNENKRTSALFGNKGLIYTVRYREITRGTEVCEWDSLPGLPELKSLAEKITGQKYTVCAIQRYPTGKIGINPHRDKEMVFGTRIAGISIGSVRTIKFTRDYHEDINIKLLSGSLYVMNPPTNQKWLHSISKDNTIRTPRYSLTFRDYNG